jgi:hypothetical protein
MLRFRVKEAIRAVRKYFGRTSLFDQWQEGKTSMLMLNDNTKDKTNKKRRHHDKDD